MKLQTMGTFIPITQLWLIWMPAPKSASEAKTQAGIKLRSSIFGGLTTKDTTRDCHNNDTKETTTCVQYGVFTGKTSQWSMSSKHLYFQIKYSSCPV